MSRRDNDATWRSLGTLCRERDWSEPRALYELQNGLPYRTVPPGHEPEIDWHDPNQLRRFDLNASTMKLWQGVAEGALAPCFLTVGIEVLPPTEGALAADEDAAESPAPDLPASPASSKNVSDAALRQCLLDVKDEHPDDPLDEETLLDVLEERLGAPLARDRVRAARNTYAPNWVLPRGRPRKRKSAQ